MGVKPVKTGTPHGMTAKILNKMVKKCLKNKFLFLKNVKRKQKLSTQLWNN